MAKNSVVNCWICGKEFMPSRRNQRCCSKECKIARAKQRRAERKDQTAKGNPPMSGTLCWYCAKGTKHVCAWMRKGKPVPGWDAEKTEHEEGPDGSSHTVQSYHVKSCPEFKRG